MQRSTIGVFALPALVFAASVSAFAQSDLSLTISGPATGVAGSNVAYTVTVSNGGPNSAAAAVADPFPAELLFVSAVQNSGPSFSCSNTSSNVVCSGGTLANGDTAQFTFTFQIAPGTASGFFLTNTAGATAASDPNAANNVGASALTVSTSADLTITKTAPATVNAGANLAYTITVSNAGPSTAGTVSWTDTLPAGLTFVSLTQTSGASFACSTGATVTCNLAALAPGAPAVFTLTGAVAGGTGSGTVYTNTATASTATTDPTPGNNTATASSTVAVSADVSITKSGPATATRGANITYTITVNNAGPSPAAGVTVSDTIPANTTFVSATPSQGTCSGTTSVSCSVGALANGSSATITLVLRVDSGSAVSNTATVTASSADPNAANNSSTSSATIPVTAIPTLSAWAFAGLATLLAAFGARSLRTRSTEAR